VFLIDVQFDERPKQGFVQRIDENWAKELQRRQGFDNRAWELQEWSCLPHQVMDEKQTIIDALETIGGSTAGCRNHLAYKTACG
jgi:hypothetical protein